MSDIKKIKRRALVLFGVASAVFLLFLVNTARGMIITMGTDFWNLVNTVTLVAAVLFIAASLGISLILLRSIRKGETPFCQKNVHKLKILAILLILFEPVRFALDYIAQYYQGGDIGHLSLGGTVLTAGLVIYCVALVFQYGIALQEQVDETL